MTTQHQSDRKPRRQADTDRLPPFAPEAEAGVLGCILQAPLDSLNECEERGVAAEWFYDRRHQVLYETARLLHKDGKPVGVVELMMRLRDTAQLEDTGGIEYLSTLPDAVPSAANLSYYLDALREKWLLRRLIHTGTSVVAEAFEVEDNSPPRAAEILARVEREILNLSEDHAEAGEHLIKPAVLDVIDDLENYHRGRAQLRGITTGLEYVDKLLCGLGGKNGNYIVISARPGIGKTALLMQIAEHVALDYVWWDTVLENGKPVAITEDGIDKFKVERKVGLPVGIFSLEMTCEALVQRMLFHRARADMQRWRTGFATASDFPPLARAATDLARANNIYIDDTGCRTIDSLKAKARRWHRQYGIKLFGIDYIQLMRGSSKRFREDRVQELSEISNEIQALGKELNTPIVVLAQMNRDYEKDPNRAPRLSDLKDCGSIEQDADLVGFLYKPKLKDAAEEKYEASMQAEYGDDWSKYPERVDIIFPKNRHGPSGNCQLLFQKSCTHFMDYNVWLKEHGHKAPAAGESQYSRANDNATDPMPTNAELGID